MDVDRIIGGNLHEGKYIRAERRYDLPSKERARALGRRDVQQTSMSKAA